MYLNLVLSLIILSSCDKQYDQGACDDLSMKMFKGFTDAKKKFADNCTGFAVKYTQELCQSALNDLIIKNDLISLKSTYGDPIENCFTPQDLKKYNTKKPKE